MTDDLNCIFCKIVVGEIPTEFVAQSEWAVAFRDIHPRQPLHLLIVPKTHHRDVGELAMDAPEVLQDLMGLTTKLALELAPESYRLQFNTGAAAGQTVFHAHCHLTSQTPKGAA